MKSVADPLYFRFDCPRCMTKAVGFSTRAWCDEGAGGERDWFCECGYCKRGSVVSVPEPIWLEDALAEFHAKTRYFGDVLIAPALPDTGPPPHTPPNVGRFFEQGMENLVGRWDAAGTMFRKTLDTALTKKFPAIKGTLAQRIRKAADGGLLTPEMADWADEIRRLGNEAAHEEEPFTEEDARALHAFTGLVLRYLFTRPGMIAAARGEDEEGGGAAEGARPAPA